MLFGLRSISQSVSVSDHSKMIRINKAVVACLLACFVVIQGQTACRTPDYKDGTCIKASDCSFIVSMFQNKGISPAELYSRLIQYKCGEAKACCPKETVPVTDQRVSPSQELTSPLFPSRRQCGSFEEFKIVGGNKTDIYEFPWAVMLEYRKPGGNRDFNCGGTLISDRYILTAAHCVKLAPRFSSWQLKSVRLGETNVAAHPDCHETTKECNSPEDITIEEQIVHEQYTSSVNGNDIALLRLRKKVNFTKFIKPACLPTTVAERNEDFVDRWPSVAGWGKTETRDSSPWKLRVEVPVISNGECKRTYSLLANINPNQICAGGEAGKDSCSGDSGGGLSLKNGRNEWIILGVVSYGPDECGTRGYPGIYTKVANYMEWIIKNMKP